MDFFGWFKTTPSNVTILKDVIWLTKQAKLNGITKAIAQRLAEQGGADGVVLVAHFRDCLDELYQVAETVGRSDCVTVASAGSLQSNSRCWVSLEDSQTLEILVSERHPLSSHDESILEFARSLPCRCDIVHHVSLEDPLMCAFSGEWVESVLKKLGMAEDEAIESDMVARQIKAAQRKIASQTSSEIPADSADAWMERNCPEIWQRYHK